MSFNDAQPNRVHAALSEEAAKDLDRLLQLTGEPSLDQVGFQSLLKGIGIIGLKDEDEANKKKGQLMFDRLVHMCREAEEIASAKSSNFMPSEGLKAGCIDGSTLRRLYAYHPSYTTCVNSMDTALALTDLIKDHFEEAVLTTTTTARNPASTTIKKDNLTMDKEATARMLRRLSTSSTSAMTESSMLGSEGGTEHNVSLISQAVDDLMSSHRSTAEDDLPQEASVKSSEFMSFGSSSLTSEEAAPGLTLEMVASSLLRYRDPCLTNDAAVKKRKSFFQGGLDPHLFDPFHAKAQDFVAALDEVVLNHDAVNHHLLTSFSMGSFGGLYGTAARLADFMDAYRFFTRAFCTNLEHTITLVGREDTPEGHYVEILEENREEENGIYDEDAIGMIHQLGLDFSKLDNVAHRDLYVTCCSNLRHLLSELAKMQPTGGGEVKETQGKLTEEQCAYISEPLVSAFEAACDPDQGATAASAIAGKSSISRDSHSNPVP